MAVSDLDKLAHHLPEVFQPYDLPDGWDQDYSITEVRHPDRLVVAETTLDVVHHADLPEPLADLFESDKFTEDLLIHEPPEPSKLMQKMFGGNHAGGLLNKIDFDPKSLPPPDCLAFYLPFHFFYSYWWGIYLLVDGVRYLATKIYEKSQRQLSLKDCWLCARVFLYAHEAYHHAVESFALRLEVTHRQPLYRVGFAKYYAAGTSDCLEESLANAYAMRKTIALFKEAQDQNKIEQILYDYINSCPPGYKEGIKYLGSKFKKGQNRFAEENHSLSLPYIKHSKPEIWDGSPFMFSGISRINSRVSYFLPSNSSLLGRLPIRPCLRPNKLIKKLKDLAEITFVRHGLRHDVYRSRGGTQFTVPRHPGDLGRGLVAKIIKQAGLNMGVEEFLNARV